MYFKNISIIDKDFCLRRNQHVLVNGKTFGYIGSESPESVGMDIKGYEIFNGNHKLIMPAFYNSHCHTPMTLLRGYGEGMVLNRWLNEKVFPFEDHFEENHKFWGALLGALEMISSGCVSVSDMYSCLARYGKGLHDAGMKANISNGMIVMNPEGSFYDDRSYRDTVELMELVKTFEDDRIIPTASIHDEYTTTDKSVEECIDFAKRNNLMMQIHLSEAKINHDSCIKRRGVSPAKYFEQKGLFDLKTTAAHCVQISDEDIDILKEHDVYMSHCLSSNLKLGTGIVPLKHFYDKGLNISLGTDGASSNNNLNMFEEMHMAAMVCRGHSFDSNAIPDKEIIKFATRNGALSQGRNDCGLIDTNMRADFIVIDLDKPHLYPDYDTIANVVFSAQSSDIYMTVCDGDVLYKNGEFTYLDQEEIKAKAVESFEEILKSM